MVWGGHGAMPPGGQECSPNVLLVQADVPKRVYSKLNMVEIFTQGGSRGPRANVDPRARLLTPAAGASTAGGRKA